MAAGESRPHKQEEEAAAAGEATAFLETSLGTRLAVSISTRTTVADLKRKVSTEHAMSFPEIGEIMVKSIKVRRRGLLYHLTDSMVVKSAFHGIKGSWFLQVDAASLCLAGHKDAKCGTELEMHNTLWSDLSAGHLTGDCTQKLPKAPLVNKVPSEGDDRLSQLENTVCKHAPHDSGKCELIGMKASASSHFVCTTVDTDLSKCRYDGDETQNSQCKKDSPMSGEKPTLDVAVARGRDTVPLGSQKVDMIKESGTDTILDEGNRYFMEKENRRENVGAECNYGLTAVRQNDLKQRRHLHQLEHNWESKKICQREKCCYNKMGVDFVASSDVATCNSDKESSKVTAALEDTQKRDEGVITFEKKEEGKSVNKVVFLGASYHDGNSLANNAETSTPGCTVNKNSLIADVEKRTDEECLQEKQMEEKEHLCNEPQKKNIDVNAERSSSGKAANAGMQRESCSGTPIDAQLQVQSKRPAIKCRKKSKGELLAGHYNEYSLGCSEVGVVTDNVEKISGENRKDSNEESGGLTTEQAGNAAIKEDSASPSVPNVKILKKKMERTMETNHSNPMVHDLADHAHGGEDNSSHGRKESCRSDVYDESSKYEAYCSEREEMQKRCKSSNNYVHLADSSQKEDNSLEKEVMTSNPEEEMKSKTTCPHKNRTHSRVLNNINLAESPIEGAPRIYAMEDSPDCLWSKISPQSKRKSKDAQKNLEKDFEGREKSSFDKSEIGETTEQLCDQSKEESPSLQGISFDIPHTPIAPSSEDHVTRRKHEVAISIDSTQEETGPLRGRQRVGVRKISCSTLKKMYS